jgi:hypothetical protein
MFIAGKSLCLGLLLLLVVASQNAGAMDLLYVQAFTSGRIAVNGKQVSLEGLKEQLARLAAAKGAVHYF